MLEKRLHQKHQHIIFFPERFDCNIIRKLKNFWIGRPASLNDAVSDYMLEGKFCREQTNFVEKGFNNANPLN